MRSLVIILTTVAFLFGGFAVYWWVSGTSLKKFKTHGQTSSKDTDAPPAQVGVGSSVGPTTDTWLLHYDKKTNLLSSRMRIKYSEPQKDGRTKVEKAEAEFFLSDKQILRLYGETGMVVMQQEMRKGNELGGFNQSPARGDLHDVTVELFRSSDDPTATMTLTMNNASFDNESLRIYTQSFKDPQTQQTIAADMVPVTIRGDDYDFDGKGLEIRWNERDHRLEFLKVYHGDRLVIKNQKFFDELQSPAAPAPANRPPGSIVEGVLDAPLPALLAAADPKSAAGPIQKDPRRIRPATSRPTTQSNEPVYRATFYDDVIVTQGPEMVAKAQRMQVDFRRGQDHSTTKPATQRTWRNANPTTNQAAAPATQPATALAPPTIAADAATPPTTLPSTGPTTLAAAPTTKPTEPVIVTWTGPLTVAPLEDETASLIAVGQAVVKLTSTSLVPVSVEQKGSKITGATLKFWTADHAFQADEGPGVPVVMTDTQGARITTPKLDFSQYQGIAHLIGHSNAHLPVRSDEGANPAQKGEELYTEWADECTLFFIEGANHQTVIDRADLRGDVLVKHPQLLLKSKLLALRFDAPPPTTKPALTTAPSTRPATIASTHPTTVASTQAATKPAAHDMQVNLKELVATDDVHCEMLDNAKEMRTIDCRRLEVTTARTADSKLYPRHLIADGNVHAVDPKQDLRSGYLSITLAPSTRPSTRPTTQASTKPSTRTSVRSTTKPSSRPAGADQMAGTELESLEAHDHVIVNSKDSGSATADEMIVLATGPNQQTVHLHGRPATATQHNSTITGPTIKFFSDTQGVNVPGPGTLQSFQQDAAGGEPRPMNVAWQTSLNGDGVSNHFEVIGGVVATSIQPDGSMDTAKGDRITLLLADAPPPTTRPSTQATTQSATRPTRVTTRATTAPATQAVATSKPTSKPSAEEGVFGRKIIQRVILQDKASVNSTTVDAQQKLLRAMQMDASTIQYDMISKRLLVPVPGTLRLEDHREPAKAAPKAGAPNPGQDAGNPTDLRGQSAMAWEKQLLYDEAGRQAVMEGNVRVGHTDEGADPKVFEMYGDRFVADLEPADPNAPPAPAGAQGPRTQVKHIHGEGHIAFRTNGLWFDADTIDYDPATHIMIARGSDRRPARRLNDKEGPEQGLETATFPEIEYNAQTSDFNFPKGMNATAGRTAPTKRKP